jgi:hypothetical protein
MGVAAPSRLGPGMPIGGRGCGKGSVPVMLPVGMLPLIAQSIATMPLTNMPLFASPPIDHQVQH